MLHDHVFRVKTDDTRVKWPETGVQECARRFWVRFLIDNNFTRLCGPTHSRLTVTRTTSGEIWLIHLSSLISFFLEPLRPRYMRGSVVRDSLGSLTKRSGLNPLIRFSTSETRESRQRETYIPEATGNFPRDFLTSAGKHRLWRSHSRDWLLDQVIIGCLLHPVVHTCRIRRPCSFL